MVIRSLLETSYYGRNKSGLPGAGSTWRNDFSSKNVDLQNKSFAEYLEEAFEGEVVQDGKWVSNSLSSISRRSLNKI